MAGEIDLVYDRLFAAEKLASGTAYERLAAIVFTVLHERGAVHSLHLRGASGVAHQIDVVVENPDGGQRRILIECKDWEREVGLGVVRSFAAAVDDIEPDRALIITTNRFTGPAKRFAAHKGIELAILRVPREADLVGLVQRVEIEIRMTTPLEEAKVSWMVDGNAFDTAPREPGTVPTDTLTLIDPGGEERPAKPEIEAALGSVPLDHQGQWKGEHRFSEPTLLRIGEHSPFRVQGFRHSQRWGVMKEQVVVGDDGLAPALVLRSIDGSLHRGFTERTLRRWTLDASGIVVPDESGRS